MIIGVLVVLFLWIVCSFLIGFIYYNQNKKQTQELNSRIAAKDVVIKNIQDVVINMQEDYDKLFNKFQSYKQQYSLLKPPKDEFFITPKALEPIKFRSNRIFTPFESEKLKKEDMEKRIFDALCREINKYILDNKHLYVSKKNYHNSIELETIIYFKPIEKEND